MLYQSAASVLKHWPVQWERSRLTPFSRLLLPVDLYVLDATQHCGNCSDSKLLLRGNVEAANTIGDGSQLSQLAHGASWAHLVRLLLTLRGDRIWADAWPADEHAMKFPIRVWICGVALCHTSGPSG